MHIPLDPILPKNFDNTPNDERSEKELDQWWNRPFIISAGDCKYDVRCLDGGAWDRSTCYGTADTLEGARALARDKLSRWQKSLMSPVCRMRDDGLVDLVVLDLRPGAGLKVVATGIKGEAAQAEIEKFNQQ